MFRNYFKIAVRQLLKNKFYSLINILGLAIGLTSCLLIYLYVSNELSYDQFHKNKDRIYRISETFRTSDGTMETGLTPYRLAPDLKKQFPGIVNFTKVDYDIPRQNVKYGDKKFLEEQLTSAESDFFSVFSFELLKGNPKTVLNEPYTVAISDAISAKYFPNENAMDKVLEFTDPFRGNSFKAKVTGVYKAMPHNSHFHRDFIFSKATADILIPGREERMGWTSHFTYLQLAPNQDPVKLEKAINDYFKKSYPKETVDFIASFQLMSLNDIHLKSHLKEEFEPNGDIAYVYIFSAIALFIILLAGINYMNLATARAAGRAREVGVRKVVGAVKRQLIAQFLAESVVITFISLVLALCFTWLALPAFNRLAETQITFNYLKPGLLLALTGVAIVVGIFSGSYPAFFLSSFQPVKVLKGTLATTGRKSMLLRRGLVVLQFSISIVLIIGTIVIYKQWDYLQSKKLGIASDQVVIVPVQSQKIQQQYLAFKNEIAKSTSVRTVTGTWKSITTRFGNYTGVRLTENGPGKTMPWNMVDANFFKAFNIPMVKGTGFSEPVRNDTITEFIMNESAAQMMGVTEPGTLIYSFGNKGRLIGIVKDFNLESLHTPVSPVIFFPNTNNLNFVAVKLNTADLSNTIAFMKKQMKAIDTEAEFNYSFLDDNIAALYKSEAKFFNVFTSFSVLAIFIACLGIVGLVAFTASQRTKEIGIRKVLGASVQSVSLLLTKEFLKLVIIANVIAWPVAYYFMGKWLEDFPYRVEMGIWVFVLAAAIALLIAIVTVSFQAIKAALANPVKSLRSE